jgi:hypothetical protein
LGALNETSAFAQAADPPRRVARLGKVGGSVSYQPPGIQESTPAEVNRPYTTGDVLWSGSDGRAELETENAAIRFSANTSLTIADIGDQATQIKLTSGILNVRLHTLRPDETFEVDATRRSFQLTRTGQYRIESTANGDNLITVRFGQADAFTDNGETESVNQGMQAQITADALHQHSAPPLDEFDLWCLKRDQREDAALSAHYVSRDLPGYADLDDAGAWRTLPDYGAVWFPNNMDGDWVPDRFGHFVQAGPWDANWVEREPWGFAPFHYGRWVKVHEEWGWIPPTSKKTGTSETQFAVRPYYSPALVAFTKFPAGTVQVGAVVGWFPLGPGEPWVPGFNASANYVARVNLSNTPIGDRAVLDDPNLSRLTYANREIAMTAVPSDAFADGRVVDKQVVRVPPDALARAAVSAQPGVDFTRQARIGPLGKAGAPPPEIANRQVVAHRMAPPPPVMSARSASLATGHLPSAGHVPGALTRSLPAKAGGLPLKKEGLLGSLKNGVKNATKSVGGMPGVKNLATKSGTAAPKATAAKTKSKK